MAPSNVLGQPEADRSAIAIRQMFDTRARDGDEFSWAGGMRSLFKIGKAAAVAAILLFSNASISTEQQGDEASELTKKVIELSKARRYADAIPIAQQILAI